MENLLDRIIDEEISNITSFYNPMDDKNLQTVSMTELYDQSFQKRPPIIDGLILPGTYIFAGAPKLGKSFLMLQIAYHTQYVDVYYGDELRENASYCFCFLGSFCNTVSSADDRDQYRFDTTRAYRESIEREEITIPLYSMSYSELVSRYPMVFSISLVMDPDTTMSEDEFDSISYDMAAVLAEDIGDDLNMSVSTCDREHRSMNGLDLIVLYLILGFLSSI